MSHGIGMNRTATQHRRPTLFVVERFWPGVTVEGLRAAETSGWPDDVRPIGWMLIPDDETVLAVLEASSVQSVIAAESGRRMPIPCARVLPVIIGGQFGPGPSPDTGSGPGGS